MTAVTHSVSRSPTAGRRLLLAWALGVQVVLSIAWYLVGVAQVGGMAAVIANGPDAIIPLPFAVMGVLIVSRRADNRIGWLFIAIAATYSGAGTAFAYALASASFADAAWPGTLWAAWLATWLVAVPSAMVLVFLPLTYPTGRLPSRAWRPVAWLGVLLPALFALASVIGPDPLEVGDDSTGGAVALGRSPTEIVDSDELPAILASAVLLGFLCVVTAAIWSLRLRYRRASGLERLQIKWFLFAAVAMILCIATFVAATTVVPVGEFAFDAGVAVALSAFPVALGGAVLRHRLYDIDRLISRSVTYALVTAVLTSVYTAGALIAERVLAPVTGGSSLAIAAATLAVAALFAPLRRRAQGVVDRRFNRRHYDAVAAVDSFRARLQTEVDLAVLTHDLRSVAVKTVEPTQAGVWLRTEHAGDALTT